MVAFVCVIDSAGLVTRLPECRLTRELWDIIISNIIIEDFYLKCYIIEQQCHQLLIKNVMYINKIRICMHICIYICSTVVDSYMISIVVKFHIINQLFAHFQHDVGA